MRKESRKFLEKLLTTPSPSGFEPRNQRIWCDYVRQHADEVQTDAYGNAVAILNPSGSPKVLIDAHMDEIGMMIKHVDDKGFIYVQRIGGVDPALVRGKRVNIHHDGQVVRGVVGATAIHLQEKDKDRKVPKWRELFVDIGCKDKDEVLKHVAVGDPITFADDFEMLNDHVAVGRALDNRVGSWVIAEALRLAAQREIRCALYAANSIQEETGVNGARMQAVRLQPDVAVAVDLTHATDSPGIEMKEHGECYLGQGPAITVGRENHPVLTDRLRAVAKDKRIDVQIEAYSVTSGTDALAYWTQNGGIPSATFSIPGRYMHSTVEMIDLNDMENGAKLLAAFAADIKKSEAFRVKV